MKANIYTELGLQSAIGELRKLFKVSGFLRITATDSKPRSLSQNAIAAVWYEQISRELGEDTPGAVKRFCKLHYGVPILRRDDADFRELYDAAIKPLPYERKLKAIGLIRVTSEMNTAQLSEYLEEMQEAYGGRVELQFPEEMARAA